MDSIRKAIEQKKFLKADLKVRPTQLKDRLLVTNLSPDVTDKMKIELYFEQRKFSLRERELKVEFDPSKRVALVQFEDPSGRLTRGKGQGHN